MSNSLSSHIVPIIEIAPRRIRRSALGQPPNGERCPPPAPGVESNMSPLARCSTRKPPAVAPVVEQRAARLWRPSALFTSSEGQRFFATRLFESRDVLESADG